MDDIVGVHYGPRALGKLFLCAYFGGCHDCSTCSCINQSTWSEHWSQYPLQGSWLMPHCPAMGAPVHCGHSQAASRRNCGMNCGARPSGSIPAPTPTSVMLNTPNDFMQTWEFSPPTPDKEVASEHQHNVSPPPQSPSPALWPPESPYDDHSLLLSYCTSSPQITPQILSYTRPCRN